MIQIGFTNRLRIVVADFRSKRKAKRIRTYWGWVSSRRSYVAAPLFPEKYLTK